MKIPADIAIQANGLPVMTQESPDAEPTPLVMSFSRFVALMFDGDARCSDSAQGLRAAVRIEAALAAATTGDDVALQPQDAALLAAVAEKPGGGYPVLNVGGKPMNIARQLMPFIEACCALAPAAEPAA